MEENHNRKTFMLLAAANNYNGGHGVVAAAAAASTINIQYANAAFFRPTNFCFRSEYIFVFIVHITVLLAKKVKRKHRTPEIKHAEFVITLK